MEQVLKHNLPFVEYASDSGTMNSSALKFLLQSPRKFLAYLLDREEPDENKEADHLRFGRAAHLMFLEPKRFKELYVVQPEFTGLTKDGKISANCKESREKKAAWLDSQNSDAVILKQDELDSLVGMVESVMSHSVASLLLKNGEPEVSGWFTDDETGVNCRFRADYISKDSDGNVHLIDLKTAREGDAGLFSKQIHSLKYYVQMAFYYDGITKLLGREPATATFLVVEKKYPHDTYVYECDDDMIEKGRVIYKHALRIYKRCLKENDWPGGQSRAQMISLPRYSEFDSLPEFEFKKQQEQI